MNEIAEKIATYFEQFPVRTYDKGQLLIHPDDESQSVYYMISGKVRQYDISYRGDEVVVNLYKPGAFFPMLGAITGRPNRYFFGAEEAVEVRVVPAEKAVAFLQNNPDVTYDLLTRLYIGVDGLLGRMAHLMAGSARSRLMYELIIECRRFGKGDDSARVLTMTIADLAAHAGLTRETASREIQKMTQEGLIRSTHKGIQIVDLTKLEAQLGDNL